MNLSCAKTYEFRAPVDPEAANLSKPANNTQCLEIDNVTFEWNKSENTESYTITIINLDSKEVTNKNSNTNSIEVTLEKGILNNNQWKLWSSNGIEGVNRHFSWNTHVRNYLSILIEEFSSSNSCLLYTSPSPRDS